MGAALRGRSFLCVNCGPKFALELKANYTAFWDELTSSNTDR